MESTKIYFDSEFTGLHQKTTLISIGFISECGKTFYAEFTDYDKTQLNDWLQENVIAKLKLQHHITKSCSGWENWISDKGKYKDALDFTLAKKDMSQFECIGTTAMIKDRLEKWLLQFKHIEMWSDCLSYDWVLFCNIWGHAFNVPANVYYIPFDICTVFKEKNINPDINREDYCYAWLDLSKEAKHNALWDAYVIRECHKKLCR
jgi:hypothetical protein